MDPPLARLVIITAFAEGDSLVVDERAVGLGAAAVVLALRAPLFVALAAAAGGTALVRQVG